MLTIKDIVNEIRKSKTDNIDFLISVKYLIKEEHLEKLIEICCIKNLLVSLDWFGKNFGDELLIVSKNVSFIDKFCFHGNLDFLKWWNNSIFNKWYTLNALEDAASNCYLDILEWWEKSHLKVIYTTSLMDLASKHWNGVDTLKWLKDSKLCDVYTENAMDVASERGNIEVLQWWKESGLLLKYTKNAFLSAVIEGCIKSLDWWKNSGLRIKCKYYIETATIYGNINVLDWCKKSGLINYDDEEIINSLTHYRIDDVLRWWKQSSKEMNASHKLRDFLND